MHCLPTLHHKTCNAGGVLRPNHVDRGPLSPSSGSSALHLSFRKKKKKKHPVIGLPLFACKWVCLCVRVGLSSTAADLASLTIGPSGVPVRGFAAGEAVQRVAGGGFEQSLVRALLLGPRGQPRDQLTHLLQITYEMQIVETHRLIP